MGVTISNFDEKSLLEFVSKEYEKRASLNKKKDYLVLNDILSVELPDGYQFNLYHLGNLFCMDWNKDGRFTLDDLKSFATMVS